MMKVVCTLLLPLITISCRAQDTKQHFSRSGNQQKPAPAQSPRTDTQRAMPVVKPDTNRQSPMPVIKPQPGVQPK